MKPTIMLSWLGPTPGLTSRAGSVLPGLIVLAYEGAGVLSEDEGSAHRGPSVLRSRSSPFLAGADSRLRIRARAWITEGGADLLAMRLMALEHPSYDWRDDFNQVDRGVREPYAAARNRVRPRTQ